MAEYTVADAQSLLTLSAAFLEPVPVTISMPVRITKQFPVPLDSASHHAPSCPGDVPCSEEEVEEENDGVEVHLEMVSSSDQLDPKSHFSFHDILHFLQMSEFPEHILHNKNKKRALRKCANKFVLEGKVLFYVGRKRERPRMVVMDEDEKRNILMSVHGAGHFGQKKTILKLEADYYWLGMISDVKNLIASCEVCRNKGSRRVAMPSMKLLKASGPWEVLGLDVLGPLPVTCRANRYLLLLIDYFSKWAEAVPLIEKSQEYVASALTVVFCRYGFPRKVFSSLGKEFVTQVNACLGDRFSMCGGVVTSHPWASGLHKATNQALKSRVNLVASQHPSDWESRVEQSLFEYRVGKHGTTQCSPFYLMFGREARPPTQSEVEEGELEPAPPVIREVHTYKESPVQASTLLHAMVFDNVEATPHSFKIYLNGEIKMACFKNSWKRNSCKRVIDLQKHSTANVLAAHFQWAYSS